MSHVTVDPRVLEKLEESLAKMCPFGDGNHLNESTRTRYEHRIQMLAERLPEARAMQDALRDSDPLTRYRVIGDPTVRAAIHTLLGHYRLHMPQHGVEDCLEILRDSTRILLERAGASPLASGEPEVQRLGPLSHHGWIWDARLKDDASWRSFRQLMHEHLDFLYPVAPDAQTVRMLTLGAELLAELLPELSWSALTHVHLVVVADVQHSRPMPPEEEPLFTSVTNPAIMGTIFLAPCVLRTPWSAAEYLLHEALHQKFLDLEHSYSMLRRGYTVADSPTISPPWHRIRLGGPSRWPVNRSISVLHVYTALALFFARVRQRARELEPRYGPVHEPEVALSMRQAFDRATYLGEKLLLAKEELGLAGQRFLDWLNELLRTSDPEPPPAGAYVHLLLDLYDREAEDVAGRIARASASDVGRILPEFLASPGETSVPTLVSHLEKAEVAGACTILSALGRPVPAVLAAATHDGEPLSENPGDLAARFRTMRSRVSEALRQVAWSDYQTSRPEVRTRPEELVRDLLAASDQRLNKIIKHLTPYSLA